MAILKTKELRKYYGTGDTCVKALDGVDFSVEEGEFVAIVGTSGSGKSTLLHMIGGLDRPTEGTVAVAGKDIFSLKDDELTVFRRRKSASSFRASIWSRCSVYTKTSSCPSNWTAKKLTGSILTGS